jgi:hypothetical protein
VCKFKAQERQIGFVGQILSVEGDGLSVVWVANLRVMKSPEQRVKLD